MVKRISIILLICVICGSFSLNAKSNEETYQEKSALVKPDDIQGHYDLGLWCKQNKLPDQAEEQFEQIIKLDPNHDKARKELGYVKYKEQWLTEDKKEETIAKEKGLVRYGDKWVMPKEMEVLRAKDRKFIGWDFDSKIQTKHYILYSATDEERTMHITNALEALYKSYTEHFQLSVKHPHLQIMIYKNDEQFSQKMKVVLTKPLANNTGGLYFPSKNGICHLYNQSNIRSLEKTLLHEATHQLDGWLKGDTYKSLRLWILEGRAEYFSTSKIEERKLLRGKIKKTTQDVDVWLRTALKKSNFIHLKEIISKDIKRTDIYSNDVERIHLYYVEFWTLTHFLIHYQNGRYEKGFMEFIKKGGGCGGLALFEKLIGPIDTIHAEWLEYIKNLQIED